MTLPLVLLRGYSALVVGLGLWIGRRVAGASDFFVAGRRLGPGLIFSTMLAANIGGGSTGGGGSRGDAGRGGGGGGGRAGVGSLGLGVAIGPAMRPIAAANGLRTVGDFLEHRYSRSVRSII